MSSTQFASSNIKHTQGYLRPLVNTSPTRGRMLSTPGERDNRTIDLIIESILGYPTFLTMDREEIVELGSYGLFCIKEH